MLTRIDNRRNVARFYKLDVQRTLFGGWSLVREWGRIGRPGTVRAEMQQSRANLRWRDERRRIHVPLFAEARSIASNSVLLKRQPSASRLVLA
ncbi:WGR domain-containing protein [Bradyrhizobium sp. AZCC 2289]|uniref:WGR domain-containing protein n=1 Tax=Bradyrhizobium sp. AZCC 2289 TaxID=3117026 RepID=UPI002FF08139